MARLRPEELAQKARFIFRGTIQRRHAATMDSVPVSDRTVVVRGFCSSTWSHDP